MNKGFSLVELIVVIAIMAILVGVAVPVYTSYIQKAEDNVEKQYADELERAVNTAYIDMKAGLSTVSDSTDDTDDLPTSVVIAGSSITVKNGDNEINNSDFEKLLKAVIDLDKDSKITYTFTFDKNGAADVTSAATASDGE